MPMLEEEIRKRIIGLRRSRFQGWLLYQVITPVFIIGICWPAAHMILKMSYSFHKSFISGDLLLLSALLFAGIVVELHAEQRYAPSELRYTDRGDRLDFLFHVSLIMAGFSGAVFALVKIRSMAYTFPIVSADMNLLGAFGALHFDIHLAVAASVFGALAGLTPLF